VIQAAVLDPEKWTDQDRAEYNKQARVYKAKQCARHGDILGWGKTLFPDKFPLEFCHELHGYFVRIRRQEFTNTEAPRFHAKTTVKCFLIPIFQALEEPESFRYYLNVQATDKKALAVNRAIKFELENNQALKAMYGRQIGERWTDQEFVLANGIVFVAASTGQSIRGINYNNVRPDYIVVDDLYDEEDINNPDSTEKKNDWFWGTLYPTKTPSGKTSVHVQGTAINTYDLLHKLKDDKTVASRSFSAVKNWDTGEVLWPAYKDIVHWEAERKRMGSLIFAREFQNERRDEATSIVKRSWLKDWEYDPAELRMKESIHFRYVCTELSVDPSIGEKSENDYTGMVLIHKYQWDDARGFEFYVESLWNEHWSLNERVLRIQQIADDCSKTKRGLSAANIEAIAGFKDFAAEVARRTTAPVVDIDSVKDKITNLENKSHFFENRKVFINKNISQELKDILVHQLTTNHPKHDDIRDALLLGLNEVDGGWSFV
jgi:hypothetical protein